MVHQNVSDVFLLVNKYSPYRLNAYKSNDLLMEEVYAE